VLDFLIENKIHRVAAPLLLNEMRHFAERDEVTRSVHRQAIVKRKPLAALDFVPDGMKLCVSEDNI
jgi:hypothetical protein